LATKKAVFIHSSELEKFSYPADCPFNTDRAGQVRKVLNSMGLLSGPGRSEAAPVAAERVVLKKFHSARYLHALRAAAKGRWDIEALNMGIGTVDCPVFAGMYDYPALATGGTLTAADLILSGSAEMAFNPSGGFHHAGPERASGFCYINDVALACIVLAEKGKRVLYLDVDVHHGDGVAYAFYDRSDVMTISLHESPKTLFPGTGSEDEIGSGAGEGYCVNVPLPVGTYDEAYLKAFNAIVPPLANAYKADVLVFELGADALAGDPLAHLRLTNNVYVEIINHLLTYDKPILMTGGGGYNVDNTVRAWALAWTVLCGADGGQHAGPAVGGVMLQTTEWQGGLKDRALAVSQQQRRSVERAIDATIKAVQEKVFPIHRL
jgi:acetoin utilization protein AcuC